MSSLPMTPEDVNQEEYDLNFVRGKHYDIVKALHNDKGEIPDDTEKLSLMISTLKDMSKNSLTKMRIKSDEKIAQGNTATLQMATQILASVRVTQPALPDTKQVIELGSELPVPKILPGELDKEGKPENFLSFTSRLNM